MHQQPALTIKSLTSPKRQPAGPVQRDVGVTGPSDGDPVCHDFGASGTIDPAGTKVTGQVLDQNGTVLANGTCVTRGTLWECSFSLPATVPAGTNIEVSIQSTAGNASVDAQVDNC
jgi:hypothetical protein